MKKHTTLFLILVFASAICTIAQSSAEELRKASEIVSGIQKQFAPDARQNIFQIKAFSNNNGGLTIKGTTSDSTAFNALKKQLSSAGIEYTDSINLMPYDIWALVRLSVASLRTKGTHSAELSTQALMGTPLRVLQKSKEFWQVQTPDGYIAWIPSSSVVEKSNENIKSWKDSKRFITTSPFQVAAYRSFTAKGTRDIVTDLVRGCIVSIPGTTPIVENGRLEIELPDGRLAYADISALTPIEEWASQNFDANTILDTAYAIEGTPYLWGGMSTKALDCSGLAKTAYFANGIILMRDASQQALYGKRIEAKDWRMCRAGDLLFFGNAKTGKVTHVAIYDQKGNYVHSSGRVKRNSLDPDSESYLPTPFLHAVRIDGKEETEGIIRARNHPWYFNK